MNDFQITMMIVGGCIIAFVLPFLVFHPDFGLLRDFIEWRNKKW